MEMKKIDLHTNLEEVERQELDSQTETTKGSFFTSRYFLFIILTVFGSLAGFGLAKFKLSRQPSTQTAQQTNLPPSKEAIKPGQIFGSNDQKTFKDHAIGVLRRGGIDGEGSHHLVRPGGPSKNVYLTSSVVDLDLFEGDKVEVWGETFGAKKAGWLMDVGRVKVLELNVPEQAQ